MFLSSKTLKILKGYIYRYISFLAYGELCRYSGDLLFFLPGCRNTLKAFSSRKPVTMLLIGT
uniref:Uncharacterized protein n=1 Tax=Anguilla anguilla TaxID=7936 RepID=A0A0E9RCE0_ANGAN